MNESTIGVDRDLEAIRAVARPRPAGHAYPGWWVRTFDGERESFDEVISVAHGKVVETGLPIVRLLLRDHLDPEHALELVERADEPLLSVKRTEARKLGLVTGERA